MLRHLLPFIPDTETARDLRTVLESDATIVICGPDRSVALRLLTLVCGHRLPDAHRAALLPVVWRSLGAGRPWFRSARQ